MCFDSCFFLNLKFYIIIIIISIIVILRRARHDEASCHRSLAGQGHAADALIVRLPGSLRGDYFRSYIV